MSTIVIQAATDFYLGVGAEFTVSVNGIQVGGINTVTTQYSYSNPSFQQFTITTPTAIAAGSTVSINYINDASGQTGDRNLYVGSVIVAGEAFAASADVLNTNQLVPGAAALWSNGSIAFNTAAPVVTGLATTIATTDVKSVSPFAAVAIMDSTANPSDSATIAVTSGGYASDADGILSGKGLTKTGTGLYTLAAASPSVLASELAGLVFIPQPQQVAAGNTVATGFELAVSNASGAGSANNTVVATGTVGTPTTIIIQAAADLYQGVGAEFTVDVNGVQIGGVYTVTTQNSFTNAVFQQFTITDPASIPTGSVISVNYINDASGPAGDRNLYVGSVTVNGVTYQGSVAALGTNGALSNAGALWSDGTLNFTVIQPQSVAATLQYVGINLSGQEQLTLPDTYPSDAEIQYYADNGLNVIRLPISWERLQPTLGGPLSSYDITQIQRVVSYANSLGVTVDLDLHNYAHYNGNQIGSSAVPISAFANVWGQLASQFAGANVMFGLMNEPISDAGTWLNAQNAAIQAIRAAGATQTVLVSGIDWDTAKDWLVSGNAATYGNSIVDPSNNYVFEVHQYFSASGGGYDSDTISTTIGVQELQAITEWAQQNGHKLFLSEFGSNSDATAIGNLTNTLTYMAQNSNVWIGAAEWDASTSYNYYFNVAPVNGQMSAQLAALDQFAPNPATTPSAADVAAADLAVGVASTVTAPTITGISASTALNDLQTANPFIGISVTDSDATPSVSALITLTSSLIATDTNGLLSGAGLTHIGPGTYSLAAVSPATLTSELAALVFTPTLHEVAPGASVTTGVALAVTESTATTTVNSSLVTTATTTAPSVTGLSSSVAVADNATTKPFAAISVADPDVGAATSATIKVTSNGIATDADGSLSGSGLTYTGAGSYTLAAASPATLTSELAAILFTPTAHQVAPLSTVTTGIALSVSEGTATTAVTASVVATAAYTAPIITGPASNTALLDTATAKPFSATTVTDPDVGAATSATITLTNAGSATDADGTLSGTGLTHTGVGTYALAAVTPATLSTELQALSFLPTAHQVGAGNTVTTGLQLSVAEGTATSTASSTLVVTGTAATTGPTVTSITVNVSEDYYAANAQGYVTIDGVQVGGLQTVTAINSSGHYNALTFTGNFGIGAQSIAVSFINDAYGGSPSLDRNMYVNSIALNGTVEANTSAPLYANGTVSFKPVLAGTQSGIVAPSLTSASGITETIVSH